MIIENLYHTIIDTEKANINIINQYDGTVNIEATSTSFDITVRLIDFEGNPVIGEEVTVNSSTSGAEAQQGYFTNNNSYITGITNNNGECTFKFTVNEIGNCIFTCNDASLNVRVYRDTGWQGVTYASGYTNHDSYPLVYRVRDRLVEIQGLVKTTKAVTPNTTATTIATIPQVFRAKVGQKAANLHFAGINQNNANQIFVECNYTNGIQFQRYGTTSTNTQVPSGTYLNIYLTYIID